MTINLIVIYILANSINSVSTPAASLADCFFRGAEHMAQARVDGVEASFKCVIIPPEQKV